MTEWGPVRPAIDQWPVFQPTPFDPRTSTYIPDQSVFDSHIVSISPRKVMNVGIKVYRSTDLTVADITTGNITYDSVVFRNSFSDPGTSFTTVTIPYGGIYLLQAAIEWDANGTGNRIAWFDVNGTDVEADTRLGTATNPTRITLTSIQQLAEGDTVGVDVRQNSTGNLDINGGATTNSLSIIYMGAI